MLSDLEMFRSKQACNNQLQETVNLFDGSHRQTAILVRSIAEASHAEYPQFAGYWDGWQLVRIKREVETKAGMAFRKDDITIVRPIRASFSRIMVGNIRVVAYSIRNGVDTEIDISDIEMLS